MKSLTERFWTKSEPQADGCRLWLGAETTGYGSVRWNGRTQLAHRVAWEISTGTMLQKGQYVRHRCGVTLCVRPEHLCLDAEWPRAERQPSSERFWSKVEKGDGCWLWTGYRDQKGYGHIHLGSGSAHVLAHRYAYAEQNGEIPIGLVVMHMCDTPACVRVDHLKLGTIADNQADMARKGRSGQRGERSFNAKLTEEKVREIRSAIGTSSVDLARQFGVSPRVIRDVRAHKSWAHVT